MRSVDELIERVSAKAAFIAHFLEEKERESFLSVYNKKFLTSVREMLFQAYVETLPPTHEVEEKKRLVEHAIKHTPAFLRHHLPLLLTLLNRFNELYPLLQKIHAHEERMEKNAYEKKRLIYKGRVKTLIAAYTRFLNLSYTQFKDIITTHTKEFAERVTTLETFLELLSTLIPVTIHPTNEAKHMFEKHRHDARFKTVAFEKLVHFFKKIGRIRMYHGVYDLGKSKEYVRILLTGKGEEWTLLFIGTVNDHAEYEKVLNAHAA